MSNYPSWFQKIRYYTSICVLYMLTIGGIWLSLHQPITPNSVAHAAPVVQQKTISPAPAFTLVSGKPVRLVLASSGIELPVDEGFYNPEDGSWTLSDTHAQYAMSTVLANNHSGNTFIYGHGTDQVFGALGSAPPEAGAEALLYTDNNHVFAYTYQSTRNLTPNDTSILDYSGPPILTVQTCTGSLSEWRTVFQFNFERIVE